MSWQTLYISARSHSSPCLCLYVRSRPLNYGTINDLSKVILEGVIVPSFEGRAIWIEPLTLVGVIFLDLGSYHILSGEDD